MEVTSIGCRAKMSGKEGGNREKKKSRLEGSEVEAIHFA